MRPLSPPSLRAGGPALAVIVAAVLLAAFAFYSVPGARALPYSSPLTQLFTGQLVAKIGATNQVNTNTAEVTVTSVEGFGSMGGFDGDISEVKISTVSGTPVNGDLLIDTTTAGWTRQVGSTSRFTLNAASSDAAQVYINGAWRQLKKTIGKPTVTATFNSNGTLLSLIVSGQASNGKVMTAVEIKNGPGGMDIAPTVIQFDPLDESTDVATTVNPVVDFNEPVDTDASAFSLVCNDEPVTFTISGSGTNSITIIPDAELPVMATCVLTVDQSLVTDVDTNDPVDTGMGQASTTFSTGGSLDVAPEVVLENSTPNSDTAEIGNSDTIQIAFSEPVTSSSAISVVCGSVTIDVTETPGGSNTIGVAPTSGMWPSGASCVLTVDKDLVTDDDLDDGPDNMLADFVLNFTIAAASGPLPINYFELMNHPTDTGCTFGYYGTSCSPSLPEIGWVGSPSEFPIGATIGVAFTEDVNIAEIAFTLVCDGDIITLDSIVYDGTYFFAEVTLNETELLGHVGDLCTFTVGDRAAEFTLTS